MRSWILAALLAASALVVSACVTEADRENLRSLVDDLSGYEQVDEARGSVQVSGVDKENDVEVVLQGDATAEEVVEVIDAIDDLVSEHDVGGFFTMRIGSEAARHNDEPALQLTVGRRDDPDSRRLAEKFVGALRSGLPDLAETRISASGQVAITPWADGIAGLTATIHAVADDPVLATWSSWRAHARPDGAHLSATRIDDTTAQRWDAFVGPFGDRDDVHLGSGTLTLTDNTRHIQLYLSTTPAADPATLRRADEQSRLWPVVRGELDLLADLGDGAGLSVDYSLADAPEDVDRQAYNILDVTVGEPIADDPYDRGWDDAARQHLDGS